MKIAFLIMNMNHGGGTERVTSIIANGLAEKKYEVSIISCQDGMKPILNVNNKVKLYS